MAVSSDTITIISSDIFQTSNPDTVYRVEKGAVNVYIAPLEKGHPVNLVYYCEIKDSDRRRLLPSLSFRDRNHQRWVIVLKSAEDEAVLSVLSEKATSGLHQNFLKRRSIDTYDEEGFEYSLIEFYNEERVKQKAFIHKGQKAKKQSPDDVIHVVSDAFTEFGQTDATGNDYYQALQFLCQRMGIDIIKGDELHIRCGKNPTINSIARASHFICRRVVLDAGWYRSDCGGLICMLDKEVVACVPDKKGKYILFRSSDNSVTPLTPEIAVLISPNAHSIGRTLPLKPLTRKHVYEFCKKSIQKRDLLPYAALSVLCALIGVLLPTINRKIYDDYIPIGDIGVLGEICFILLTFMAGNVAFSIVKNLFGYRITSRVGNDLQNAVYHRLFHLPEAFFRKFDSADLAGRIASIGMTASSYANAYVVSGISGLFSLFYLIRMFSFSTKLTWICVAMYAVYLILIVWITSWVHKGQIRISEAESESSAKLYQYLNGVDKLRMAGVEDRALLSYMKPYSRKQYEEIKVNRLVSIEEALTTVVKSVFSCVLYWYIVKKLKIENLSSGTFVALNSAFGMFTGALDSFVDEMLRLFQERNEIKRFWPVFDTAPEDDDSKEIPGPLSGAIKLENVSFAYGRGTRNVLSDLSLTIKPGEYIGIVGPSGCGKSTLLKLLLGFETPQKGVVTVDQKDLRALNKNAYRRQLGVVLQNGNLISGSIYENITITAPDATFARVNEIVRQVGLQEDIAKMPMGLRTELSESSNTISGGQKQRILIARAICGDPKILIFDEATSALDNVTQAAVSKSLDEMKVTRIVVAHRLSTIKNCNRILVMDNGSIVEEGNYNELMAQHGLFYALASRQIAEV